MGFNPFVTTTTGLAFMTGGGTISLTTIQNAIAAGYPGMYLNPLYRWNMSGLVISGGVSNFIIESRMTGSIGWNGVAIPPAGGFISVDNAAGDGIQVYASVPAGNPVQGLVFNHCAIIGNCPGNSALHLGGGERQCGLAGGSYVQNTSSTAGSFAVTSDTALSNNNGEDLIMDFSQGGGLAGAYAALGLGIADQTQHTNDILFLDLKTHGGTYGIQQNNGGGHTFINSYDRSNPSTALVYCHGGTRMTFIGGEEQNNTGQAYLIDAASGGIYVMGKAVTQAGAQTTTVQASAGIFAVSGMMTFNNAQTMAVSGTAKVFLIDPLINPGNLSVSGTAGQLNVITGTKYTGGAGPTVTGWTGTTNTLY